MSATRTAASDDSPDFWFTVKILPRTFPRSPLCNPPRRKAIWIKLTQTKPPPPPEARPPEGGG